MKIEAANVNNVNNPDFMREVVDSLMDANQEFKRRLKQSTFTFNERDKMEIERNAETVTNTEEKNQVIVAEDERSDC